MKNFVDANGNSLELEMVVDSTTPGLMTNDDKAKLDGIEAGANNYVQPTSFPPSIIAQNSGNRFSTDAEKTAWNAKASTAIATTTANGLMSAADKVKLDSIATNANVYTHPTTHPPSIIVQDASNRFVTDAEKTAWNAKASSAIATTTANGLMSAADKVKLNNLSYEYGVSGTNHYKKYGDGTLEMWGRFQLSYTNQLWASTLATSGISYSVPFTITFPVTAVGTVECNINIESINVSWASIQSITTTSIKYILVCGSPDKTYDAYIHWSAKGKWK